MKEYQLVYLNKGIKISREKDLEQAQSVINDYIAQGWVLQQVVSHYTKVVRLSSAIFPRRRLSTA